MRLWMTSFAIAGLALSGRIARADQCHSVGSPVALEAKRWLLDRNVLDYCEPCGDAAPGEPTRVTSVELRPSGASTLVVVNGRERDLAYTFVQTSPDVYRNVGALAGCAASDVSDTLRVTGETAHGVLITPGPRAAPPPPIPSPPPALAAPAAPPPVIYVHATTPLSSVLALAIALGGGLAAGALATLAASAIRRRRALRPRAIDLNPLAVSAARPRMGSDRYHAD